MRACAQKHVYVLFSRPCIKRSKISGSDEKLQEPVISGNNKRWSAVGAEVEPEILEDMGVGMLEDEGPGDVQKKQKSSLEQVTEIVLLSS